MSKVFIQTALFLFSFIVSTVFALSSVAENKSYPISPERSVTPGSFCKSPDAYRYPEKIAYCNRDVNSSLKYDIFKYYNEKLGYRINMKERMSYKIDHFIPLCAGGSNERDNLWPQHQSVYEKTDAIEAAVCDKMKSGRMLQRAAVDFVFEAKMNPDRAQDVLRKVLAF
jgi:hypothetical protein